jgi:hypothetical protein
MHLSVCFPLIAVVLCVAPAQRCVFLLLFLLFLLSGYVSNDIASLRCAFMFTVLSLCLLFIFSFFPFLFSDLCATSSFIFRLFFFNLPLMPSHCIVLFVCFVFLEFRCVCACLFVLLFSFFIKPLPATDSFFF